MDNFGRLRRTILKRLHLDYLAKNSLFFSKNNIY